MNNPTGIILIALVSLLVFLLGRELVCWYFKLNRIADTLDLIARELHEHRSERERARQDAVRAAAGDPR